MPYKDPEKRRESCRRNMRAWIERNSEEHRRRSREAMHKYYMENPEIVKINNKKAYNEGQKWWDEFKSKLKCVMCGEDHPACLEFHHRNPEDKKLKISQFTRSSISKPARERLLKEIEKCDVLCANCHRKFHNSGNIND